MDNHSENTKRIAKNTLMLYGRMLFTMVVSLYTSRVVLNTLGVEDYGIYNVVGGFVAMFSLISSSLSSSVSRFLTFELGKGDMERLKRVFSTSLIIHIGLALIVLIAAETIGLWFVNHKMVIPPERLYAANWVFQTSIFSFMLGLFMVTYNATIVAHERMSAFAFIGILDVLLRLGIILFIAYSPWKFDRLITYSILLIITSIILQCIYYFYCKTHFPESHFCFSLDKSLIREMTSFAGWNFFGNGAYILNTQGVSILINLFFGVVANSARGIANQVNGAISSFVGNFTAAMNPQITKSFASGDLEYMHKLVCSGAKLSFFMTLFLAVPIICETETILTLWLKEVPQHTIIFTRLTIASSMTTVIGGTLVTGMAASGDIKRYQLIITSVGFIVFPLTWVAFKIGLPVSSAYWIFLIVYFILIFLRIYLVKDLININPYRYLGDVILRCSIVTLLSFSLPICLVSFLPQSLSRLFLVLLVSFISTGIFTYSVGLSKTEQKFINFAICKIKKRYTICNSKNI